MVDSEEEGAHTDDHSSDEDEGDGDGDDANGTHDYYANQDQPPEETVPEAPKQSALLDLLAGKKPDDVLEDLGATQAWKGKGPISGNSGKAPAPRVPNNPRIPGSTNTTTPSFTPAAWGVQEHAQGSLIGAANLAHVTAGEEQVIRDLKNYTGLLAGLQQLVVTMAQGFQDASKDIRELVSSTLARATERDRVFVQRASAALGEWTLAHQAAIGGQFNLSMFDMLRHWDQVRAAGNWLVDEILSLTAEGTEENTSVEIFHTLLPACFNSICACSEAVFRTMNADLPSLLCHFVSREQAGQMLDSIFTTMCNYNTEMCGMALSQTVIPIYTIPNTYRTQRSLWESIYQIVPEIARQSGSELCPFEPRAPNNTPFDVETQPNTPVGNSGNPGASNSSAKPGRPGETLHVAARVGTVPQPLSGSTGVPVGIPPKGV